MKYKEAMNQTCRCGKFLVGGWLGKKRTGRPCFSSTSCSQVVYPTIVVCEEHTFAACYAPQQIA